MEMLKVVFFTFSTVFLHTALVFFKVKDKELYLLFVFTLFIHLFSSYKEI